MKKTGWIKKSTALLFALLGASICRADSTTSRLNLVLPTIGSPIWGQKINGDMQIIDAQVAVTTTSNTFVGPSTFNNAVSIVRPGTNSSLLLQTDLSGAASYIQLKNSSGVVHELGIETASDAGGGRYPGPASSFNVASGSTYPVVISVNGTEEGRFSTTGFSASTITVTNNLTLGSVSPGNCLETDGSGKLIDAGFPCGSGGGGGVSTINTLTNGATNFIWNTSSLQSGSPSFFVSSGTVAGQFKANTEILSGNGPSTTPLVITGDAGLGQTADLQQWNSAPGFRTAKIGPFGEGSFGSDYLWSGPTSTEKLSVYGQGVVARFGYEATPTSTIDLAFVYNNAATFNKISFRPFTSGSLSAPAFDFDDASGSSKFSINVNDLDWGAYVLSTGTFRFYDADNSNYAAFQASHTITSDVTWVLPSADGSNGQVLTTNGAGNLSWTTASGGSGSPGGSTGQLQYNNGGSFGGIAGSTVSTSGTIIAIQPQHAADIPISIMAAPSQSGYLFKTTDSAGNILDVIDSAGDLTLNKYLNGVSTLYMSSSFISGYGGVWIGHDNTTATGANYAFLGNASTTLFNGAPDVEFRGNNLTGLILHNDGAVTRSVFGYAPTSASGDSIADVSIIPFNGLYKGLVVKADAAQSVNLQEWQNSSGVALSSVTASGVISGPYRLIGHTIAWFHANAPLSSSKGEEYYCEDCTVTSVAISTGATTGSWAIPSSKTTFPN